MSDDDTRLRELAEARQALAEYDAPEHLRQYCRTEARVAAALRALLARVEQAEPSEDEREAPRVGIVVESRRSGKTLRMIDALLDRATERGVRVEIIEPAVTDEKVKAAATALSGQHWSNVSERGKRYWLREARTALIAASQTGGESNER